MKIVFMGTPNFAKICLEKLIKTHHSILAVVTAKDKPSGRGNKITMPEVKKIALDNNIPVFQFEKIRFEGVEILKNLNADIFVTASFGQILSQEILDIPKYGVINVHGSLLPKYRGASPIQTALLNGDKTTGVTIMKTDAGVDTGDIILQESFNIEDNDNCETLMTKCANVGGDLLIKALDLVKDNKALYKKQDERFATKTKMFKKENAKIDFSLTVLEICNKIRAYAPEPACYFKYENNIFQVYKAKQCSLALPLVESGTVVLSNSKSGLVVACADGFVEIEEIKPANKKMMPAKSYLNGHKIVLGAKL